jgi:hypothetical protein
MWPRVGGIVLDEDARHMRDNSSASADGTVRVYFRELEGHLTRHVQEATLVVGCVAWLTSEAVLRALAQVQHGVVIVVQKEDWWRPDVGAARASKRNVQSLYRALKGMDRGAIDWPGLIGNLNLLANPDIEPVRCVGNYNREKRPAFPRMHNKFLVFCQPEFFKTNGERTTFDPRPYAAWTGSFNLTQNACRSLENALYVTDPNIVAAYYREWAQIEAISEPLDWETDWVQPEWRIGT